MFDGADKLHYKCDTSMVDPTQTPQNSTKQRSDNKPTKMKQQHVF